MYQYLSSLRAEPEVRSIFYEALTEGKADAALAASLFHYKELEISDLKDYLAQRGVSVRR